MQGDLDRIHSLKSSISTRTRHWLSPQRLREGHLPEQINWGMDQSTEALGFNQIVPWRTFSTFAVCPLCADAFYLPYTNFISPLHPGQDILYRG